MAEPSQQYWVVVGSRENHEISRDLGFTIQGIKSRQRKKAEQIEPGDRMIYYLTGGLKVLAGIVTVKSPMTEDYTEIWDCSSSRNGRKEVYPYRFKIEPYLIPEDESGFVSVAPIHSQLQYLKKWPEKNWTLGFQGNLHQWPKEDYLLVETLFKQNSAVAGPAH